MKQTFLLSLLLLISNISINSQDRITGKTFATRSEVIAQHGMAATSQPLATQVALDILKKEKRMKTLDDAHASNQESRDADPQLQAQRRESAAQAGSLMEKLPNHQREVIRLKVHSGLSYREISELTGLSVSNVGYLLHTGLKSIRTRLATIE